MSSRPIGMRLRDAPWGTTFTSAYRGTGRPLSQANPSVSDPLDLWYVNFSCPDGPGMRASRFVVSILLTASALHRVDKARSSPGPEPKGA